ncbi:NAD-dependent epimerase/dehydratase family protein [Gimibacter soli]|uniref:NAD(P)-dependent oxidoreductase n=1 Tax=Gimibacter soli TaxID=3024400 RepID=A0AAE9XN40_9PROT|nr:NAD(P)-dependent oxidoreductase [Gimibacter soli]WCL53216.1 NAD(P)-dependent oxidoreductase [Gimibacter soli]
MSDPVATAPVVALTGATGFLGGHLIDSLLRAGYRVRALTRRTPTDNRTGLEWIKGDLDDEDALEDLCEGAEAVIHAAGLVKALSRSDYFDVNLNGTLAVLKAAADEDVKRFFLVSSLSAREPRLTHYGASKAAAELAVSARPWPFRWTIIRPPAIYGPGDMEILKLFKATRFGLLPNGGSRDNRFSMIHGADMAEAIVAMLKGGFGGQIVEVDDGRDGGYRIDDIARALGDDEKTPRVLAIPRPLVIFAGAIGSLVGRIIGKPLTLNLDKARLITHPDWLVRGARRPSIPGWTPVYDLKSGLKNTIEWYRLNRFL